MNVQNELKRIVVDFINNIVGIYKIEQHREKHRSNYLQHCMHSMIVQGGPELTHLSPTFNSCWFRPSNETQDVFLASSLNMI